MVKPAKLHEADIANFFNKVTNFGAGTMRTADLMRWMGWDKQTSGFWAEIHERFVDTLEEHEREEGWQLLTLQNDSQITLLCFDPEGTSKDNRWWTSVRALAERPAPGRRKKPVVADE